MLTLANNVIQLTKSNSKIVYESLPSDDPKMRKPDIRKAMEILSWSPEIDLHTGLVRTIEDFIKRLQDEE
jgi:nucleoside-diphosphate-sugar epimerase